MEFGKMYMVCGEMVKRHDSGITSWVHVSYSKPKAMLYIGKRTVKEGRIEYEVGDYGGATLSSAWVEKNRIQTYFFVENTRRNPIYVHPDQVITGDDES